MPPAVGQTDYAYLLRELREIQNQLFDKASNYTRLILGLGYGGFFAAWSGTKQNLSSMELVSSALLVTFSLFLYVAFEIWQARMASVIAMRFALAVSDTSGPSEALERFRVSSQKLNRKYFAVWKVVFHTCAVAGLLGALILIAAFVHSLFKML
ncbi:MAG TPA: hypothetical protein VGR48_03285 [Terriglobales bacterium]|nr:hypothetical protein [Terriglobales bacterium]